MTDTSLYDLLDVRPAASATEIKAAFRRTAKRHHPDAGGSPELFVSVTRAYTVLSDPDRRKRYDETGQYDADAVDNAQGEMILTLSRALERVLSSSRLPVENVDIVQEMRLLVRGARDLVAKDLSETDQRLASLSKARKRIVRKDEAENLFLGVIDAQIAKLSQTQAASRAVLRAQLRALDELDRYSSVVDVIRFVQAGRYPSSGEAEAPAGPAQNPAGG